MCVRPVTLLQYVCKTCDCDFTSVCAMCVRPVTLLLCVMCVRPVTLRLYVCKTCDFTSVCV